MTDPMNRSGMTPLKACACNRPQPVSSNDLLVPSQVVINLAVQAEVPAGGFDGGGTKAPAQIVVGKQPLHARNYCLSVARRSEEASDTVLYLFRNAAHRGSDDGRAAGHGFQDDIGEGVGS